MGKVTRRGEAARQLAVDIVKKGGTFKEAALATGFCVDYVRQLATKAGLHEPRCHKGINKNQIEADRKRADKEKTIRLARKYKAEGKTHKEVAELLGISEGKSMAYAKGIAPQSSVIPKERLRNQWSGVDQTERVARIVKEKHPGFEYAGNYTGSGGSADIRCTVCGTVTKRNWHSVRMKGLTCPVCAERRRKENEPERIRKKEEKKAAALKEREQKKHERLIKMKSEQIGFKVCPICNSLFYGGRITCSSECAKKRANRKDKRVKRRRAMVDRDITLEAVAIRDRDICYLCGAPVEWNDIEERDGNKIAGDSYPSIDHVIPLAAGGLHAWDNVRLAHRRCNYLKSDTIALPGQQMIGT